MAETLRIAVVGDRKEEYLTHREIDATLGLLPADVRAEWTPTATLAGRDLAGVDAVWLAPGSPYADDDAVLAMIDGCIDRGTPFLGTCGGFQYACMALARRVQVEPAHAEVARDAADPVIVPLACSLYGEVRPVEPVAGTLLAAICGEEPFPGFHFCGYGLAPGHEATIERAGGVIGARAADAGVEAVELPGHPFFLGTSFQPQVGAADRGEVPPLLAALLAAARFARLVARYRDEPGVTLGTGFGSNPGLRVGGRIFAMLVRGALVVKLPRPRVDDLVDAGDAVRFEPGTGRTMREWASVGAGAGERWDALVDEAFAFVGARVAP